MRIKLQTAVKLSEIAELFVKRNFNNDADISYVSTDTRELFPNDLFVGILGESYDGASFTAIANSIGAYTLAVNKDATIEAKSSDEILSRLIIYFKEKLTSLKCCVAITGSVGKTTAKELLCAICKHKYKTHASYMNYNNLTGLFHTVITAPDDTELLIVEMGMNSPGEISLLSSLINPNIAVITTVGSAHVGELGSRENIARAKLEITDGLLEGGKTVIPYGEPLLKRAKGKFTFSMSSPEADAFFIPLKLDNGGTLFDFYSHGKAVCGCRFNIPGEHIFSSMMASFAAAVLMGLSPREISSSLQNIKPTLLRPTFLTLGTHTVYDDTYSSSPEALYESMKMLTLFGKPTVAVIGDMLELGDSSAKLHRKAGKLAAELGYKRLYLIGEHVRHTREGAIAFGIKPENIHINKDISRLSDTLLAIDKDYGGEIILVKASHKMGLDRLIKMMKERWT